MSKYFFLAIFLHLSLYANKASCTPIFNNDIADLYNSEEGHDVSSMAVIDPDKFPSSTTQPESFYSSSDRIPESSSTTHLPSYVDENIDKLNSNPNRSGTIDWRVAFVGFSMIILFIILCKCCTYCLPNLCELMIDMADTRRSQQRERQSTSATTADNRCKTCHERTPHHAWPHPNNCAVVTVFELEQISVPVLPPNLPSQIMPFPTDNEAFNNDSEYSEIAITDRAQNCETPPPPYSPSLSGADNDNRHGVSTVD